jgi:hypothetical protein
MLKPSCMTCCTQLRTARLAWHRRSAFEHRLRQLLEEQRHAVGMGDDPIHEGLWQRSATGDPLDQRRALRAAQPVERVHGDMRKAHPGRLELRKVMSRRPGNAGTRSTVRSSSSKED